MPDLELNYVQKTRLDLFRGEELEKLARDRFDKLSDAELEVLRVSASFADPDFPKRDPVETEKPGPLLLVRAELIRWLATDPVAAPFIASKGVRAFGVTIPEGLDFYGCCFLFPLTLWQCNIEGEINLQSAETKDFFVLDCAVKGLAKPDPGKNNEDADPFVGGIDGARVVVNGSFHISGSSFYRGVSLAGAKITGDVNCMGATLLSRAENKSAKDPQKEAASGTEPEKTKDPTINNTALLAGGARVEGSVFFVKEWKSLKDFRSYGDISLAGAVIGGDLLFNDAGVGNIVSCENLQLSGDLIWRKMKKSVDLDEEMKKSVIPDENPPEARSIETLPPKATPLGFMLSLRGATIRNLKDDKMSWPSKGRLLLNGFVYAGFEPASTAGERINWLQRQLPDRETEPKPLNKGKEPEPVVSVIEPQPWIQLAAYLDSKGDHRGAKHVLYELKRLRAGGRERDREDWKPGLRSELKGISEFLRFLLHPFSYGRSGFRPPAIAFAWLEEVPLRIAWSIILVLMFGTLIFHRAAKEQGFAPTDEKYYPAAGKNENEPVAYPKFNSFVYTLENGVPLVKLGQDEKWAPNQKNPSKQWWANYWFLMSVRWLLILSGWLQATVLAAALSGLFKE